ncbi:UTP--glucose-1-phosphate uridylyltransferase GalU [Akkermansiaceae bacterium]|nr:UTP--glucose-1-phosphate uridylyltransferase GalU [Akkermansiaceae bacterium]MDA7933552.1 UTP--glucose-1-phosphate uridylyltransferase GalU [Akkermansiaceae bacterium]MDB4423434.1 UTP--glucose-1-phosphate uridylyltransferase GalU [bacterium]
MKVRKAIIPAAGLGTRFLPMTKAIPKEMLPVVDKPVIQYVVEECVNSGIEEILIVIGSGKRAIEEHFGRSAEFERKLMERGKPELSDEIRRISEMANIHYVWQNELKGLGDAVLCGKSFCGNEPFALLLGDTIVESANPDRPVLKQLLEIHEERQASVVALEEVPDEKVSRYGIAGGTEVHDRVIQIDCLIEKPSIEEKPSNLAIASRYLFRPEIFALLEETPRGKNNEVQLTDAMSSLLSTNEMYGLRFEGKRYDIGNKLDFLETNLEFGIKRPDLAKDLREFLSGI